MLDFILTVLGYGILALLGLAFFFRFAGRRSCRAAHYAVWRHGFVFNRAARLFDAPIQLLVGAYPAAVLVAWLYGFSCP